MFQDCNDWGDNTTAVTGLSDLAFPPESMGKWGEDLSPTESIDYDGWRFICQRYMGAWTAAALSILAFFSPILMVILPQMDFVGLSKDQKKCKVMRYLIWGNHDIQCSSTFYASTTIYKEFLKGISTYQQDFFKNL